MHHIYEIRHPGTGAAYIGLAKDVRARWRVHRCHAVGGGGFKLHAALRKYGCDGFDWSVRACLPTLEEAQIAERIVIALERPSLNLTAGGEGMRATAEVRAKIAAKSRGRKPSEETRSKIRAARARQVNLPIGPFDEAHRAKLSAAHLGKHPSAETRAKRSASLKRAYAEGRGPSKKGRVTSVETRAKLSAAGKRAYAEGRRKRGTK